MPTSAENSVLVVGSCIVDLAFHVDQLPEPGETKVATSLHRTLGGKGFNQAVALARLGVNVTFVGAVGDKGTAQEFRGFLRQAGGQPLVEVVPEMPTGTGVPVVDAAGENTIVVYPGAAMSLPTAAVTAALDRHFVAVLVHLEAPEEALTEVLVRARSHGALTVVNPAPWMPHANRIARLADVVVPNLLEARRLIESAEATPASNSADDLARECARALAVDNVVVTMGDRGAVAYDPARLLRSPAFTVPVVDVTGAGDAFVAALVWGLVARLPMEDVLKLANAAGALACSVAGGAASMPLRDSVCYLAGIGSGDASTPRDDARD